MGHVGVGLGHVGWGGSCRGGVGHEGVGWFMEGWVGHGGVGLGHVRVGSVM